MGLLRLQNPQAPPRESGRCFALALSAAWLASCAWFPGGDGTPPDRDCNAVPDGASEVSWRRLELPPPCPDENWVFEGGGPPQLPRVEFPIRDELALRQAFACIPDGRAVDVDFGSERVDRVDFYGADRGGTVAWIARVPGEEHLVARAVAGAECGGVEPRSRAALLVVPRDAPPLETDMCRLGSCPPGPAPP